MDPKLVEKITRMVISELEAHSSPLSHTEAAQQTNVTYQPLTEAELQRWNEISTTLGKTGKEIVPANNYAPLTNDEIRQWKQLSTSIGTKVNGKQSNEDQTIEKVKFSRFY